jgi:signal transduction histidine kinase
MMLMPASAEFATLCQSQLAMMTKLLGADSTAVYMAEGWSDQKVPNLLPIAVYPPESPSADLRTLHKALPASTGNVTALQGQTAAIAAIPNQEPPLSKAASRESSNTAGPPEQLAIPMVHEGGVFGVLVSWRADRPWRDIERERLEECARSLTLACVLDQRGTWLKTQMSSLDHVQAQQSDRFHELLHQLRSPLTALKTFGKLLTKRLPTEDPNRRLVTNMLRESDRMQELLGYFDDTLQAADDSREDTGTTIPLLLPADDPDKSSPALAAAPELLAHFGGALTIRTIAIAAIALPLVELTQPLAEDAGLRLQAIVEDEDLWVQADPNALAESLSIVLDNALKYATPGSQIWLEWGWSLPHVPDLVGILVGDTGPGIPPEDQGRIFERHYRGLQAAGDLDGSGLGLAIAADLVQAMNGYMQVFSPLTTWPYSLPEMISPDSQQHGTIFVIWLPRAH